MVSYMLTLSERMNELRLKGYKEEFNIQCDGIDSGNGCIKLSPDDFQIDAYYRFEGQSDPADEAILYAISSERYGLKGLLVNGYGVYSDDMTNEMLKKLSFK